MNSTFVGGNGTKKLIELFLGRAMEKEGEQMEEMSVSDISNPFETPIVPEFYGYKDGDNIVPTKHVEGSTDVTVESSYEVDGVSLATQLTDKSNTLFTGDATVENVTFAEGIDTSSLTNTSGMFKDCSNLQNVDMSNLDMSSVTDTSSMFENTGNLQKVTVNNTLKEERNDQDMFKNSNVSDVTANDPGYSIPHGTYTPTPLKQFMYAIVNGYVTLNGIATGTAVRPLPEQWVVSSTYDVNGTTYPTAIAGVFGNAGTYARQFIKNVIIEDDVTISDFRNFFSNCNALETIKIGKILIDPNMDVSNQTGIADSSAKNNLTNFLSKTTALKSIEGFRNMVVDGVNMSYVKAMLYCTGLETIDLSWLDFGDGVNMYNMCYGCSNLTQITFSQSIKNISFMDSMFASCPKLTELDLTSFNTTSVDTSSDKNIFSNCSNLVTVKVSQGIWTIPEANNTSGCSKFTGFTYV